MDYWPHPPPDVSQMPMPTYHNAYGHPYGPGSWCVVIPRLCALQFGVYLKLVMIWRHCFQLEVLL